MPCAIPNEPALREELVAAYARIARLSADLEECREFLEEQMYVLDAFGAIAPNRAMQLVNQIDEGLNGRPN